MSLETLLENLIAAVNANTAALQGGSTAGAASEKATTAKSEKATTAKSEKATTAKTTKPKFSVEQASSLLLELKEAHGVEHAKAILTENGVAKMAEMPAEKAEAIYEAAKAKLEELGAAAKDDDDEGI
jgi:hypothetical protein